MDAMAGPEILHYVGYDGDHGGIFAVIRNLASVDRFRCVAGVGPGFRHRREPFAETVTFAKIAAEDLSVRTIWRSRLIAQQARGWLAGAPERIFHGHSRAGLAVALWLERMGETRGVVSVHCYGRQRWLYRWAARRLGRRLFWLSPAMKRYYGVAGAGEDDWHQCIPSCVAAANVAPRSLRDPREGLALGGIGAIVRRKGWHVVIDALAALPAAVRERVSFHHIGAVDGSPESQAYADELRASAATLTSPVRWHGEKAGSKTFLTGIDCLVMPSDSEPLSLAILEALQAGVPVLAADSGGPVDIISPGRDGWFFRTGDAEDLARNMARLVETGALAGVRIDAGRLSRFTAPVVAAQWSAVYAKLLSRAAP